MQLGNFISEDATSEFNKRMLFKLAPDLEDIYAFDTDQAQPDSNNMVMLKRLGIQDFDTTASLPRDSSYDSKADRSAYFGTQNEFNDPLNYISDTTVDRPSYFRISAICKAAETVEYYRMGRIVFTIERNGKTIYWQGARINNKLPDAAGHVSLFGGTINQWRPLSFFVRVNESIHKGDQIKVYGWNPFKTVFSIDDLAADWYIERVR